MSDKVVSIGVVAQQTGCNIETIRYYEREGLLPAPGRSPGGHRQYRADHIHRLNFIRRSRELGFSMQQVRGLLALVDRHEVSCVRVRELAEAHRQEIRERIRDLRRMETTLAELVQRCSGDDVPDCPIVEALNR